MQSTQPSLTLIRQGITWSTLEGVLFQAVLVGHNLFLFRTIPLELYGITGVLFSMAYALAYCMSSGFELFYSDTDSGDEPKSTLLWIQGIWIFILLSILLIIRHWLSLPFIVIALAI